MCSRKAAGGSQATKDGCKTTATRFGRTAAGSQVTKRSAATTSLGFQAAAADSGAAAAGSEAATTGEGTSAGGAGLHSFRGRPAALGAEATRAGSGTNAFVGHAAQDGPATESSATVATRNPAPVGWCLGAAAGRPSRRHSPSASNNSGAQLRFCRLAGPFSGQPAGREQESPWVPPTVRASLRQPDSGRGERRRKRGVPFGPIRAGVIFAPTPVGCRPRLFTWKPFGSRGEPAGWQETEMCQNQPLRRETASDPRPGGNLSRCGRARASGWPRAAVPWRWPDGVCL